MEDVPTPSSEEPRRFSFVAWIMGIVGTIITAVAVTVVTDRLRSGQPEKTPPADKPASAVVDTDKPAAPEKQPTRPRTGSDKGLDDEKSRTDTSDD